MVKMIKAMCIFPLSFFTSLAFASEGNFNAELSLESMYFFEAPTLPQQSHFYTSLTFQPEYKQSWDFNKKVLNAQLFVREDFNDDSRSHVDIRELSWTQSVGDFDYKVGVSKEFWGVAESYHLVDIINQLDNVEEVDFQSRLGQPMVKASYLSDVGSFHAWVLPYFRERNFTSNKSRAFSGTINVNEDEAKYYSSKKEKHIDYALRYSNNFDEYDLGFSYFQGTSREPVLTYDAANNQLVPFYDQLKQLSTDVQWTGDALLLKLEALLRDEATFGSSSAITTGFEYTFFDINNGHDVGIISEYIYDGRGKTRTSFDNDVFWGVRYTLNDIGSTEILAGGFIDLDNASHVPRFKLQQRINDKWKYELIVQGYENIDEDDLFFYNIRNDDFFRFNLRYYL
ncbi:hypothetical protein C0W54_01220 [Photobacterium kishitanii]|uniref:hypothetical protein n=1 Tax=Photobacterium kishitanii TaxID=318456 RepID=UPI000D16CE59|nr:hypothetical protein [Photobacterium kishitanii]PSW63260.1 hypothetical protein C0W54_01220 [Photobacterium kishitanii]